MKIVRDLDHLVDAAGGHALTIGFYDGVHLGHQAVIRATQESAARFGGRSAVVTFDPHPAYVLRPESAPLLLTDLEQKLELIEACNVDTVVVIPFDETRASESAEGFVERVVVSSLKAKAVIIGADFHFGRGRAGNVDLLTKMGAENDFEVEGVKLLQLANGATQSVSSTAIRRAIAGGEIETVTRLLGRNHEIRGPVTEGDQRGRTIGFPTANVAVGRNMAVPADGVYAGWYVRPDGSRHPAAINIGKRPTFYQNAEHSLIEAHLIEFDDDLYGEPARVQIVRHLRSEQKFDGIEALSAQLQRDVAKAATILERAA